MIDQFKSYIPNVHKEGVTIIVVAIIISFILGLFSDSLGWLGTFFTLWCVYFFRDPKRVTPSCDSLVISPADGVVQAIEANADAPEELQLEGTFLKISIFLDIFNVHVNRIPVTGKIVDLHYHPGTFVNASLDKASKDNERQSVLIQTENYGNVAVVQIAGLVARRIICQLEDGQTVEQGQRFGIIRFGSRVDLYLPNEFKPLIHVGQTMVGGETIIGSYETLPKSLNQIVPIRA